MQRLLAKLFGIRDDESTIALLMALYHFVLLITLYLLKPVRDSLFLSGRGPDELPFVFILTTLAIIPVAGLYSRAGQALRLGPLINGVSLFLVATIIGLRLVVETGAEWSLYVLYVCVSIYGVLVTSQFWLLANALFNASQAKRVFTMLSVGAILGAIAGGEITGLLVEEMGMDSLNLLWVCAALLTASLLLVNWIRYRYNYEVGRAADDSSEDADDGPRGLAGAFRLLQGSTHLQLIVALIAVAVVTTAFIDFQFKTVATRAYTSEGDLTSFLGRFYSRVSIVALIAQFVIAPRLMRVLGVGGALSILPLGLAVGAAGMLVVPGLVAGVLLRGTDQSLRHSIDKTGRELLFVPVDLETKKRVKVFIDLFVDEGVHGVGGVLLILFTVYFDLGVQELSIVVLVLLALWGTLAYCARQSYIEQFRQKLREQEDFEPESTVEEKEAIPHDLDELLKSLCSQNENQVHNALDRLEEGTRTVPVDVVRCLLVHESGDVRAHTVRMLTQRSVSGMGIAVADLLTDPDPDVQLQAARYLYCDYRGDRLERLQNVLHHPDPRIRSAAVGLIAEEGGEHEYDLLSESLVRELIDDAEVGPEGRIHVARVLGTIDHEWRDRLLIRLLQDDSPRVVRQAIESAGQTQARAFVNHLLSFLGTERYEEEAAEALAIYGDRTLGTLHDYMVDHHVDAETRVRIPAIMASTPKQLTVDVLVHSLGRVMIPVRHAVIQALSKLHAADDAFDFNENVIEKAIETEVEHYTALRQIMHLARRGMLPGDDATLDRLRDCCEEALERIFRLLGLRYDQQDIYTAYLGLTGDDASLQASAVEFVDNLVDWTTSRYLLPLLDDPDDSQARSIGRRFFDLNLKNQAAVRRYLESADDPRLRTLFRDGEAPVPDMYGDGSPAEDPDAEVPRVSQS